MDSGKSSQLTNNTILYNFPLPVVYVCILYFINRGGEGGVYVSRVVAGGQSEKGGLR